jgi:hypothetical protein
MGFKEVWKYYGMNKISPAKYTPRNIVLYLFITFILSANWNPMIVQARVPLTQFPSFSSGSAEINPLVELIPGMPWSSWYLQESGFQYSATHFGAYVTLGVGEDLYIGLGTARPAENSQPGALLAKFDGQTLTAIGVLTEEGVHDMHWDVDRLHIAGTDPCCGDDWSAGNHWVYRPPDPLIKYRDPVNGLIDALHTWGLWTSPTDSLYAAVSVRHNNEPAGEIFKSDDDGVTWTKTSALGAYRSYDIIGFDGKLYALHLDLYNDPISLAVSTDNGENWEDVLTGALHRTRLTEFQGSLLAVSADRQSIYSFHGDTINQYALPANAIIGKTDVEGFNYNYNLLAVAEGSLYAIWEIEEGGEIYYSIVRTDDLLTWDRLTQTPIPLVSLSYWPAETALITSSAGVGAKLWKLDLSLSSRVYLPTLQ